MHLLIRKEKLLIPHTNRLKPKLTEANKHERLEYCLAARDPSPGFFCYKDFTNTVFLDEKWFYITTDGFKMYLLPDKETPYRSVKHKSHVEKLMVLVGVTCPRRNLQTGEIFDGKIGCFAIGDKVEAKHTSKHCEKGSIEFKSCTMTREVYIRYLCEKVIPSIIAKWPQMMQPDGSLFDKTIYLQADNAPAHVKEDQFQEIIKDIDTQGLTFKLRYQPPNSPDLNVLDLALF